MNDERGQGNLQDGEFRAEVNGVVHWYRIAGAYHRTTPIIVLHGGPGGNVYAFERTIGPLLEQFATLVYYEQRGCGRSAAPADPGAYSLPLLVADLDVLRQALNLERIIPLGFSFGGELAAEYALAHPQHVERLILQAPSISHPLRTTVQLCGFDFVARGEAKQRIQRILAGSGTPAELLGRIWELAGGSETVDRLLFHDVTAAWRTRELWQESGLSNTGTMARALGSQPPRRQLLLDQAGEITVPTLVLVGLHDRNVGIEACRDVAASIPRAELVIFEQSAHFPDVEEPKRYAAVVQRFLRYC